MKLAKALSQKATLRACLLTVETLPYARRFAIDPDETSQSPEGGAP